MRPTLFMEIGVASPRILATIALLLIFLLCLLLLFLETF